MRNMAEFITRSGESEREKKNRGVGGGGLTEFQFAARHTSILETDNWRFGMLPETLLDRGRGRGATSSSPIHDRDRFITHLSARLSPSGICILVGKRIAFPSRGKSTPALREFPLPPPRPPLSLSRSRAANQADYHARRGTMAIARRLVNLGISESRASLRSSRVNRDARARAIRRTLSRSVQPDRAEPRRDPSAISSDLALLEREIACVPRVPRRSGLFAGGRMAVTLGTTILLAATSLGVLQRLHVRNIIGRSGIYAMHLRPTGAVINKLGSRGVTEDGGGIPGNYYGSGFSLSRRNGGRTEESVPRVRPQLSTRAYRYVRGPIYRVQVQT
jgi:hypothetical protein